jgi:hypothetical protein
VFPLLRDKGVEKDKRVVHYEEIKRVKEGREYLDY